MIKKLNKKIAKLLSTILISSVAIAPMHVSALENSTVVKEQKLVNSKTVKTGTVNTKSLNVRKGAGTSYSKIGCLSKGTKVNIVSKLSNGWYKIKYKNGYGYVSGKYVTNVKTTESTTSSSTKVIYKGTITGTLNVRRGGSTSYAKIGYLSKGAKVNIVSKLSNGWYKIKYKNGYGYISGKYVTNVVSVNTSKPSNPDNTSSTTSVIYTGIVNITNLDIRKGASESYDKIGSLSKGTKVEIIKVESNGWYKIKYKSRYGYISRKYVDIAEERKNLNNFLFVGDSFTVLLSNTIKSKNDKVYIHAKSGSMPGYWLDKVSSMPSNSKVDGVVLLIGVNGAGYESNKTHVKSLINKLSAKYPDKTIYVQKVFPVGKSFANANPSTFNKKIASLNSVIESQCSKVSNAKFIDTTSGFVDNKGYLIHHNGDGLHIASSYNNKFYNNIFNAIKNAEK